MIPNINVLTKPITEITYPTRTYKIRFGGNDETYTPTIVDTSAVLGTAILGTMMLGQEPNATRGITYATLTVNEPEEVLDRINGYTDDLDALAQAIYLILGTERYEFIIYSWDYGIELVDLYGKPMPYVMSELPRRITEALTQDDRIVDVEDFSFEVNGNKLHTTFTVISDVGKISTELEVVV